MTAAPGNHYDFCLGNETSTLRVVAQILWGSNLVRLTQMPKALTFVPAIPGLEIYPTDVFT